MTERIQPNKTLSQKFIEIIQYRDLVYFLALRNIKVKYRQTFIGVLWTILQSLIMMIIFVFFFSKTLKLSTDSIPAPLFYLFGLIIWIFFSSAVSNSSNSIILNAELIKRIYFPRIILPLSTIAMAILDFIINFCLLIIICIVYILFYDLEINMLYMILYILAGVSLALISSTGIGIMVSSLSVYYRDFLFLMPFVLQLLFFSSPIIYASSMIESDLISNLIAINPLVGAIEIARFPFSQTSPDLSTIFISIISGISILIIGFIIYLKTEKNFADVI